MKKIFLIIVAILAWQCSQAQEFPNFIRFVLKRYHVPESIKNDCNWNYAVVKIMADSDNVLDNVSFLNEVSEDMKKSLEFLKGYNFSKEKINSNSLVFVLSIDYTGATDCHQIYYNSPSEVISKVFSILKKQQLSEPNSIILYDVIIASVSKPIK